MLDRGKFFAALRGTSLFPAGLKQFHVDGLNRLLNCWEKYIAKGDPSLQRLAYDLATSWHETANTLAPITERGSASYFLKYEPGTPLGKMLGNTQKGDGYRYRGEGDVQNTGRRNAAFSSKRLNALFGLQVDFVARPDLRGDPLLSALCLFVGNSEGWWTGKALRQYIDETDEADSEEIKEFIAARHVVNGTDRALEIAQEALVFAKALKSADGV